MIMEGLSATEILDLYNIKRTKCKRCGNDIIYKDTNIHISKLKDKGPVIISGHSYLTKKLVDGIEYKLTVCEECLRKKFVITNLSRTFNVMSDITKYAFNIPNDVFESSRSKYAMTKEKQIEKYGLEEGTKRWEAYCKKQAYTNTFEYKNKKYGMTKSEFDEFNKSRAITRKNLVKKYGLKKGTKYWKEYVEKQRITKSWDYMVEKFGEDGARKINRKKLLTLDNFIRKYGEKEGAIKYKVWFDTKNKSYSSISQNFFNEIDFFISKKYNTLYATKNREEVFYCSKTHTNYYLDYYIPELKLCVEFNGSCYHGDKRIFKDDEYCNPFSKLTAKELRDKDDIRYKALEKEHGIKTVVVWELDYNNGIDIKDFIENTLKITI